MNKGSTFSKKFHFIDEQDVAHEKRAQAAGRWAPVPRTACGNFKVGTIRATTEPAVVTCCHCVRVIVERTKLRLSGSPKSLWSRYAK